MNIIIWSVASDDWNEIRVFAVIECSSPNDINDFLSCPRFHFSAQRDASKWWFSYLLTGWNSLLDADKMMIRQNIEANGRLISLPLMAHGRTRFLCPISSASSVVLHSNATNERACAVRFMNFFSIMRDQQSAAWRFIWIIGHTLSFQSRFLMFINDL